MGLAASQARFLAITSRKLNCEFQSMQIAQEKLSVTRDLQKAAQEYQNSLSATKLIWDCDTVDNDVYNLSYDLMMKPSAINEYDPYLITDTKGKIVLSESMWNAAVAAGIIDEKTGNPLGGLLKMGSANSVNDGSRNAFLYQLGYQNAIDPSTLNSIVALGDRGYTNSGIGGEIVDKTIATIMNTTAFINTMQNQKYDNDIKDANGNVVHKKGDLVYGFNLSDLKLTDANGNSQDIKFSNKTTLGLNNDDKDKCILTKNDTSVVTPSQFANMSLADILTGKYVVSYYGNGADDKSEFTKIATKLLDEMAKILGKDAGGEAKGLNVTSQANDCLNIAYEFTKSLLNGDPINTGERGNIYKDLQGDISSANETNAIVSGGNNTYSISISNLLNAFLTNFVIAMEGYDCGLNIKRDSKKDSNYITEYLDYNFQLATEVAVVERDMLNADFYNQLYNQLCTNGASTDAIKRQKITDNNYLAHALKNGQLFVSTLNSDGYFYQGPYTMSAHIAEVKDEDAIARAEAEYNTTKSKLNYKEETLEIEMKNLDTEISALTTEFDTVKGLISKSVEKVFTMFN